jgi:hypothetical protein
MLSCLRPQKCPALTRGTLKIQCPFCAPFVSLLCPLREQIAIPSCIFSFSFFEDLELFATSKFPVEFIEESLAEANQAATSSSFDILALGRELPIGIRVQ